MATRYSVAKPFKNKDRAELLEFKAALKAVLTNHPNKLHTVLFDDELHPAAKRALNKELDTDDVSERLTRHAEALVEYNEEAYAILYSNIACPELQRKLRDKHDEQGHDAWLCIEKPYSLEDNDTRLSIIAKQRQDFIDDGLTGAELPAVKTFVETIEGYNLSLVGTAYEMLPMLFTTLLLDSLAEHVPDVIDVYKTKKQGVPRWRQDFDGVKDSIYQLIEDRDRTAARSAASVQRKAFRTKVQEGPSIEAQLAATQQQLAAMSAQLTALQQQPAGGTVIDVMRTQTQQRGKPCKDCGKIHPDKYGCIGKRIIDGELTLEQAAAMFTREADPAKRMERAKAAQRSAAEVRASAGGAPAPAPAPAQTITPAKKVLGMCTRVVHARSSAAVWSPVAGQTPPTGFTRLGMDSKCDQTIICDQRFFPFGIEPLQPGAVLMQTIEGEPTISAKGTGTAVVVTTKGTTIVIADALYVPDALRSEPSMAGLVSVEQSFKNAQAEVRFGAHRDIVFHAHGGLTVELDAGYDLTVRPPTADDLPQDDSWHTQYLSEGLTEDVRRELEPTAVAAPVETADASTSTTELDPITRGRSGGGTAHLPPDETALLWSMRMPGLSAARLRQLPKVTADAPSKLEKATPESVTDDATLLANAPRLHPPSAQRKVTTHRGQCTMTDLIGPFTAAKFTGNRYGVPHIDLHTGTTDVDFMPSKDKFPKMLRSYVVRNQGVNGADFRGGTMYCDNEKVLNSAKVEIVLEEFDMHGKNSAEYEPWGNPAERTMRTLQEPMRIMHERGGAGPEYWQFTMQQAAFIADDSHHAWGRPDDGMTPTQRKTGQPPRVATRFRPMFCKAFVRLPPPYRTGKTDRRAELAIHLGINQKGPGWLFEILQGPRKGRLVRSTQAIFRENQFPLRGSEGADEPTSDEVGQLYPADDHDEMPRLSSSDGDRRRAQDGDGGGDLAADEDGGDDERGDDDDPQLYPDSGDDADPHDAGDDAVDPAPRRSSRVAGNELPYTTLAHQSFRGVLHTQAQRVVGAFATSIDMTSSLTPQPLMVETEHIPIPTPHDAEASVLPRSFDEIMRIADETERGRRLKAYYKEYDGLFEARSGIRVVPRPTEPYRTVKLKEIPSTKKDGSAKLRVVVRGDLLKQGVDYGRTFSPTVKHTTMRVAAAIGARRNQRASGGDVSQAYVRADWPGDEPTLYASKFPDGYDDVTPDGIPLACEIGNVYGKPPAGRNWYKTASRALVDGLPHPVTGDVMKFNRSEYDWSYFWRWEGDFLMQLLLYVDDLLIWVDRGTDMRERFMATFAEVFPVTDFGEDIGASNSEYLSIRILLPAPYTVTLDCERYITDITAQFFPGGVHASYAVPARLELPMLVDEAVRGKEETIRTIDPELHTRYRSLVGALLFIAITTRPDVQYAVGMLTRCVAYPTAALMTEAERVQLYLYATRTLKMTYKGDKTHFDGSLAPAVTDPMLEDGSSDASFEGGRSTSGYVWRMSGAAVSWGMKKQASVALFTTEAEIMAASLASCDAIFLRDSCIERGFPHDAPSVLCIDNKGAIDLSHDPVHHASTKHIKRRELFIRDLVLDGTIRPVYVKSANNVADIFTKPLQRQLFQKHRAALLGLS